MTVLKLGWLEMAAFPSPANATVVQRLERTATKSQLKVPELHILTDYNIFVQFRTTQMESDNSP